MSELLERKGGNVHTLINGGPVSRMQGETDVYRRSPERVLSRKNAKDASRRVISRSFLSNLIPVLLSPPPTVLRNGRPQLSLFGTRSLTRPAIVFTACSHSSATTKAPPLPYADALCNTNPR